MRFITRRSGTFLVKIRKRSWRLVSLILTRKEWLFLYWYSRPPPPNTADLGTDEKAAVFGNQRYSEIGGIGSHIYNIQNPSLGLGNGRRYWGGGMRYWEGQYWGGGGTTVLVDLYGCTMSPWLSCSHNLPCR